jgi:hypothetical protein
MESKCASLHVFGNPRSRLSNDLHKPDEAELEETSVGEIAASLAVKQRHGFAGVVEHVPKAN